MGSTRQTPSELYGGDYYAWVQDQVRALRDHRTEAVDWENVAEELDDLGKSVTWSVESHLETLIGHLLKLTYAHPTSRQRNARSWESTVELTRFRIRKLLDESRSVENVLKQVADIAYHAARISARRALGFVMESLPDKCPWTVEQLMDETFFRTRKAI